MLIGTLGLSSLNLQLFVLNFTESSPPPFIFWRVSICILEDEIVLGVLYRKGGDPKKGVA